jgi:hypothetical protein
VPGKILEIRHALADNWRTSGNRDVLLLDIALDNYFRWEADANRIECFKVQTWADALQCRLMSMMQLCRPPSWLACAQPKGVFGGVVFRD